MKKFRLLLVCAIAMLFMASCNTYTHSMKTPNAFVEYHAEDFDLSPAVTGEATVVRVLGIDWERLFGKEEIGITPSVGTVIPYIGLNIPSGYNGKVYVVLQDHRLQEDWKPSEVPALYRLKEDPADEWPEWVQPTGAHDAYAKGAKVTFEGEHYVSLIDANVYSPAAYPAGWQKQ